MEARTCSFCQQAKPFGAFGNRAATKARPLRSEQVHSTCRECRNLKARLKKRGLTHEQFQDMLKAQDFKCKLCDQVTDLFIDHDHKTNKVRGLICNPCNWRLGFLESTTQEWLDRAELYTKGSS